MAYKFPNPRSNPEPQSKQKLACSKIAAIRKVGNETKCSFKGWLTPYLEAKLTPQFYSLYQTRSGMPPVLFWNLSAELIYGINNCKRHFILGCLHFYTPLSDVQEKTQSSFIWTPFYIHIKADEFNFTLLLRWETTALAANGSVLFCDLFSAIIRTWLFCYVSNLIILLSNPNLLIWTCVL